MEELWLPVKGYENLYWISNFGRLKNPYKILKIRYQKSGKLKYVSYSLQKQKKIKYILAHRLVAKHFLENPNDYKIVHHKDNNTLNNRVDNLEWCSHSDNARYAFECGRRKGYPGMENPMCKYSDTQVLYARELKEKGLTRKEISILTKINLRSLEDIIYNKSRVN